MGARQQLAKVLREINVVHPKYDAFLALFDAFYPHEEEHGPAIGGHEIALIRSIDPMPDSFEHEHGGEG